MTSNVRYDYDEKRVMTSHVIIGLYRDVWIAAIASSRTSLATLTGVMYNTSQCELRSLRVNSGMMNVIRIVTYYTLPPVRVARLFLDCNGVFAIKAYWQRGSAISDFLVHKRRAYVCQSQNNIFI